jgi:hypothetical protein
MWGGRTLICQYSRLPGTESPCLKARIPRSRGLENTSIDVIYLLLIFAFLVVSPRSRELGNTSVDVIYLLLLFVFLVVLT